MAVNDGQVIDSFSSKGNKRPGPKGHHKMVISSIVELKRRNPRFGCPRIAYTISITFGIEVNKDVVRRILARHYKHSPPNSLSTDNDPLFTSHRWQANLRILDVNEIKSIPCVLMSHLFIERGIGTVRRERLDHTPFWNSLDPARKVDNCKDYYYNYRTDAGLSGQSPAKYSQLVEQNVASINDCG